MPEVVPGFTIVETLVKIVAEPRRSSRLHTKPLRFKDEVLLL